MCRSPQRMPARSAGRAACGERRRTARDERAPAARLTAWACRHGDACAKGAPHDCARGCFVTVENGATRTEPCRCESSSARRGNAIPARHHHIRDAVRRRDRKKQHAHPTLAPPLRAVRYGAPDGRTAAAAAAALAAAQPHARRTQRMSELCVHRRVRSEKLGRTMHQHADRSSARAVRACMPGLSTAPQRARRGTL
jgi:hypothetical protein